MAMCHILVSAKRLEHFVKGHSYKSSCRHRRRKQQLHVTNYTPFMDRIHNIAHRAQRFGPRALPDLASATPRSCK